MCLGGKSRSSRLHASPGACCALPAALVLAEGSARLLAGSWLRGPLARGARAFLTRQLRKDSSKRRRRRPEGEAWPCSGDLAPAAACCCSSCTPPLGLGGRGLRSLRPSAAVPEQPVNVWVLLQACRQQRGGTATCAAEQEAAARSGAPECGAAAPRRCSMRQPAAPQPQLRRYAAALGGRRRPQPSRSRLTRHAAATGVRACSNTCGLLHGAGDAAARAQQQPQPQRWRPHRRQVRLPGGWTAAARAACMQVPLCVLSCRWCCRRAMTAASRSASAAPRGGHAQPRCHWAVRRRNSSRWSSCCGGLRHT